MKRFVLFIFAVVLCFSLGAQTKTTNGKILTIYKALGADEWSYEYTPVTGERISPSKYDTIKLVVLTNKVDQVNASGYVGVSSRVGTTDSYAYIIAGKMVHPLAAGANGEVLETFGSQTASAYVPDTALIKNGYAPYLVNYNKRPHRYFELIVANDNSQAATDSLMLSKLVIRLSK